MSKFDIASNGPYFSAILARMTTEQVGQVMVKAQCRLETAENVLREMTKELIRECAGEYHRRKYPAAATH